MNNELDHGVTHRIILAVAPNGSRRGKSDHPAIPLTKGEILQEAAAWRDAGASVLHVHVRDREGVHSLDADIYKDVLGALRNELGDSVVLQMTSESGGIFGREVQMDAVRAVRPEAVSLALRELAPDESQKGEFVDFLKFLEAEHIAPQIILYDLDDLTRLTGWITEGALDGAQLSVLYVLGRYTSDQKSNPVDLLGFLGTDTLPFRDWMVCAFGPQESRCAALAALLGGHVRVGFENNIHLPDGSLAPDNTALVAETAAMLDSLRLELAGVDDVRALWRIG